MRAAPGDPGPLLLALMLGRRDSELVRRDDCCLNPLAVVPCCRPLPAAPACPGLPLPLPLAPTPELSCELVEFPKSGFLPSCLTWSWVGARPLGAGTRSVCFDLEGSMTAHDSTKVRDDHEYCALVSRDSIVCLAVNGVVESRHSIAARSRKARPDGGNRR